MSFNDETLSEIADIAKIKKAYKLGSLPSAPAGQVNGTGSSDNVRLENSIIGAIALRGAT